jgi:hypothetical protein
MTRTFHEPPEGWGTLDDRLLFYHPAADPRPPDEYQIQAMPAFLAAAFSQMLDVARLRRTPQLMLVRSTHGPAGFTVRGQLIVIGRRQVRALAHTLRSWGSSGAERLRWCLRVDPRQSLKEHLRREVMQEVLLHQLAHVAIAAGYRARYRDAEESADYLAGKLAAQLDRSSLIGQVTRSAAGRAFCSVTGPDDGGAAPYLRGYGRELRRHARQPVPVAAGA